ncbi:glycosyltransferase family 2 protein [Aestuariibaculum sediminum]|uniref:Glycosyltransferase family 2 protein n=1 Tax=Aestuariibaculum sediminum TaxID=2770637 RepID=A0A8J6Q0D2_9FLAO|nr:glycosyltransferase family A protein [Aestuariibaculum sediminum]MBD0833093.1 glycosyltransferase family 2 protein [Aestuariibaculum sediminum]
MITLTLTYRNRDLHIVKRCLDSLKHQTDADFNVCLVDYGSTEAYSVAIQGLLKSYTFVTYYYVNTNGQLWNKSRAINIALKSCKTSYFLVGDIDLIYHPEMIKTCKALILKHEVVYFQYGFLNKEESQKDHGDFFGYQIEFLGNKEVTGTTLYKTKHILAVNGYDEFYHGWGAEDTDIHLRLKNNGVTPYFYDKDILVKHQWHPKTYRSNASSYPFHSGLERINHKYMMQRHALGVVKANQDRFWGVMPYETPENALHEAVLRLEVSNLCSDVDALVTGVIPDLKVPLEVQISKNKKEGIKAMVKRILGKTVHKTYALEDVNNRLLESIIISQRLARYHYEFDREKEVIQLTIKPYGGS